MKVFVLLESCQTSPVAVFKDSTVDISDFLPKDAVLKKANRKPSDSYSHREIMFEWSSEIHGTTFRMVCYSVI